MNFTEAIVLAVEKVKAWIQSGGVKWDHVSDKPFVKVGGDTLTWDGNTEGLVGIAEGLYKISDAVPTFADFQKGGTLTFNGESVQFAEGEIVEDDIVVPDGCLALVNVFFVIPEEMAGVRSQYLELTFPEAGIYVPAGTVELQLNGYTGFAKEQIDPKVLPEALQFGESETVILEEQELAYDAEQMGCVGMPSAPINAGDTLTVKYDGAEYECNAERFEVFIAFGNLAIVGAGDDTGEPFFGMLSDGKVLIGSADESSHTVGISKVSVEKLNPKYYNGQTVLFVNGSHLFSDKECTTLLTARALREAATNSSLALHLYGDGILGGVMYADAVGFPTGQGYGIVYCNDGSGNVKQYFTAEYTA